MAAYEVVGSSNKGIANKGEKSCFLNVVLQSLQHLTSFRSAFLEDVQHTEEDHPDSSCIQ